MSGLSTLVLLPVGVAAAWVAAMMLARDRGGVQVLVGASIGLYALAYWLSGFIDFVGHMLALAGAPGAAVSTGAIEWMARRRPEWDRTMRLKWGVIAFVAASASRRSCCSFS
jgi:hypothetical protein